MTVGGIITAIVSATFLAAVLSAGISAIVTSVIARKKFLEEERARVRTIYAEAFQAVAAYKELPYAIRRRRRDQAEAERVRLSEEARKVQVRLSYYRAWTQAESDDVGEAYAKLVAQLRATAGAASHQAWADNPIGSDADMNIGTDKIDLSAITPYEDAFIAVVTTDGIRALVQRAWIIATLVAVAAAVLAYLCQLLATSVRLAGRRRGAAARTEFLWRPLLHKSGRVRPAAEKFHVLGSGSKEK